MTVWTADMLRADTPLGARGQVVGPVWSSGTGGVAVACEGGLLILRMVQLDGSDEVDALTLVESGVLSVGDVLG
jgi:hypothetical protein